MSADASPTSVPSHPAHVSPIRLADVASLLGVAELDRSAGQQLVCGITLSSTSVVPGDLYAALPGSHTHGARFAADATRAGATATMREWERLKNRNPGAKLVCVDIQPYGTSQAPQGRAEILIVGGFSDAVFDTVARFVSGETRDWVDIVKQTEV